MKRLTREEVQSERLLRAARAVAVLGASARRGQRGNAVVEYLKRAGFDVFPVRPDRKDRDSEPEPGYVARGGGGRRGGGGNRAVLDEKKMVRSTRRPR